MKKKSGHNPNLEIRKRQLQIIFKLIQQLILIIFPEFTIIFLPLCLTVCGVIIKNVGSRYTGTRM